MQGDTFDAQTRAPLMKFRRPVTGSNRAEIRKERTAPRQIPKNFRHFIIETHDGNGAGFLARETDDVVFPINVFSFEAREIGLRRAQVPRQFIERFAFRIHFAGDDGLMFLPGDGTFFLELNFRPLPFYDDRPRQPCHVQGEVMDAPQINIGRNFSGFEHAQKVFRPRFQNRQVPNQVKRLVLDGGLPAVLHLTFFEFDHLVHDELPVARGNLRVAGGQIGPGDLQVHGGLLLRFVARMEESNRRGAVGGMQAVLLAGHVIVNVVASAFFAAVEPVSLSHSCFIHSDEVTTVDLDSGREQVGVTQGRPELYPAGTSAGTRLWKIHKPLPHLRLGLEAEVGIGLLRAFFAAFFFDFSLGNRLNRRVSACIRQKRFGKGFGRVLTLLAGMQPSLE